MSLEINQKLHEEKSPYQSIAIYETKTFGRLMTLDNLTMLTSRDNFIYHEMMSHPALYNHPNPKDVAIVGGGACGTLKEVLKHDTVKKVTQIELDERVTRVSEQYFPELCESNSNPRVSLVFEDAISWMQNVEPNSLDVIILDTTEPVGKAKRLF
ncbi:MAG: spermidine synthase [Gammaproteobacteria bacterium]|jgi:spermidine synthase